MKSKSILSYWSLPWIFFGVVGLFIYMSFYNNETSRTHLEAIPTNVDYLVVVDVESFMAQKWHQINENPNILKEYEQLKPVLEDTTIGLKRINKMNLNIIPVVGIFGYSDSILKTQVDGMAVQLRNDDRLAFCQEMSKSENIKVQKYLEGWYGYLPEQDYLFFGKYRDAFALRFDFSKKVKKKDLTEEEIKRVIDAFFDSSNSLLASNSVDKAINNSHLISGWVSGEKANQYLPFVSVDHASFYFEMQEDGLVGKANVEIIGETPLVLDKQISLQDDTNMVANFSIHIDPQDGKEMMGDWLPAYDHHMLDKWDGNTNIALFEFLPIQLLIKNKELDAKGDSCRAWIPKEKFMLMDFVELNELSHPYFNVAIEMHEGFSLETLAKNDTTILPTGDGVFKFKAENMVLQMEQDGEVVREDQYIFCKQKNNVLYLSPLEFKYDFDAQFASFGMRYNHKRFIENYNTNDYMGKLILKVSEKIPLYDYSIDLTGHDGNNMLLDLKFRVGDPDANQIVELIKSLQFNS